MSTHVSTFTVHAIVTRQRGSWKYQDAYGVSTYAPKLTKRGVWVWAAVGSHGKYSWPQLRRNGLSSLPLGSKHHRPLTPAELSAMAFAAAGLL